MSSPLNYGAAASPVSKKKRSPRNGSRRKVKFSESNLSWEVGGERFSSLASPNKNGNKTLNDVHTATKVTNQSDRMMKFDSLDNIYGASSSSDEDDETKAMLGHDAFQSLRKLNTQNNSVHEVDNENQSLLASSLSSDEKNSDNDEDQKSIFRKPYKPKSKTPSLLSRCWKRYEPKKPSTAEESLEEEEKRTIKIATAFLMDYEKSKAPTLPKNSEDISSLQLKFHSIRFSRVWESLLYVCAALLFVASTYEDDQKVPGDNDPDEVPTGSWSKRGELLFLNWHHRDALLVVFTALPILLFTLDIIMLGILSAPSSPSQKRSKEQNRKDSITSAVVDVRKSRSQYWARPLIIFFVALSADTVNTIGNSSRQRIWMGLLKPMILYYLSSKARMALDALHQTSKVMSKILCFELFLIFTFAAIACQLYSEFASFQNLPMAFISMFELSTTVVNPSLWLPVYDEYKSAALFFILFLTTSVFYLHSLVLSVVFQSYMHAMKQIRERSSQDREDALCLTFQTLHHFQEKQDQIRNEFYLNDISHVNDDVSTRIIKEVLTLLRPHYGRAKISALVDIVDPERKGFIGYDDFRSKIPKALGTSLRTIRSTNDLSHMLGIFSAVIAVSNLAYTLCACFYSKDESFFWGSVIFPSGSAITLACVLELFLRFNPCTSIPYMSIQSLNGRSRMFDGLAVISVSFSLYGIFHRSTHFLVVGRSMDMMRCMSFAKEARDLAKITGEIFPAMMGPLALLFTAVHMFAYVGMFLWGGHVTVGIHEDEINHLYDLNNFNCYASGLMTMFEVLVINDWHEIAKVFLFADNASAKIFVYTFFISGNLIGVSILLNVLTAFFVGAFVTKFMVGNAIKQSGNGIILLDKKRPKHTRKNSSTVVSLPRPQSIRNIAFLHKFASNDEAAEDINGTGLAVSERQGFDNIIKAATGEDDNEDDAAEEVCQILEVFESLLPGREKIGYLVSCKKNMNRFGNFRFNVLMNEVMDDQEMHSFINGVSLELDMLMSNVGKGSSVRRCFDIKKQREKLLEVTASLLKEGSSLVLFVARKVNSPLAQGNQRITE